MIGSSSRRLAWPAVAVAVAASFATGCGGAERTATQPSSTASTGSGTTSAAASTVPTTTSVPTPSTRAATAAPTPRTTSMTSRPTTTRATSGTATRSRAAAPTPAGPRSPSSRPSPTSSRPGPTTTTAVPGSTRCDAGQLQPSIAEDDAGAGQRYATLTLRNTGSARCTVRGYAGLQLLAGSGTVPTRVVPAGGPARSVTLRPGARVRAQLHWSTVPGSGDPSADRCPPTPDRVQVTPPGGRGHDTLAWGLGAVCGGGRIDQEPFQPGS